MEKYWLLTWNPKDPWDEYEDWAKETKNGKTYDCSWNCKDTHPKVGDHVFMKRSGNNYNGIVAHGVVIKEPYKKKHYKNSEKEANDILDKLLQQPKRKQRIASYDGKFVNDWLEEENKNGWYIIKVLEWNEIDSMGTIYFHCRFLMERGE